MLDTILLTIIATSFVGAFGYMAYFLVCKLREEKLRD
mgnify:CR=1 FL=1